MSSHTRFGYDGPIRTFVLSDAFIGFDHDHNNISVLLETLNIFDVSSMKEIERSAAKNDDLSFVPIPYYGEVFEFNDHGGEMVGSFLFINSTKPRS